MLPHVSPPLPRSDHCDAELSDYYWGCQTKNCVELCITCIARIRSPVIPPPTDPDYRDLTRNPGLTLEQWYRAYHKSKEHICPKCSTTDRRQKLQLNSLLGPTTLRTLGERCWGILSNTDISKDGITFETRCSCRQEQDSRHIPLARLEWRRSQTSETDPEFMAHFRYHWFRSEPMLVTGLPPLSDMWGPEKLLQSLLASNYSTSDRVVINCRTKKVTGWSLAKFLQNCETSDGTKVLRVRDFPGHHSFSDVLPQQSEEFLNGLPVPEYMSPHGPFNLYSMFPSNKVPADLGPKAYIAYGSGEGDTMGISSTPLHQDMCGAVSQ